MSRSNASTSDARAAAIRVGGGDHQDQPDGADVTGLQLRCAELSLEIGEPRDHLDGQAHLAAGERHVDRAKVAGDRDRRLERHVPRPTDARDERRDVSGLGGVPHSAARRPEVHREPQTDDRGVHRKPLAREPARPAELTPADLGGR